MSVARVDMDVTMCCLLCEVSGDVAITGRAAVTLRRPVQVRSSRLPLLIRTQSSY